MKPPVKLKNAITSRVKIMSNLDIAERRLPQDGRIKLVLRKEKEVDFRVSVLPTLYGEKVVARILDKSNLQLDMTKLGFDPQPSRNSKARFTNRTGWFWLRVRPVPVKPRRCILRSRNNKVTENISTAEDPVEFNLTGVTRCSRMTHWFELRGNPAFFLRQDPDIIMVGEIRDFETAEIAIKAALTGREVLSTLHTTMLPLRLTVC